MRTCVWGFHAHRTIATDSIVQLDQNLKVQSQVLDQSRTLNIDQVLISEHNPKLNTVAYRLVDHYECCTFFISRSLLIVCPIIL